MFKKISFLVALAIMMVTTMVQAQVTTASLSGKVMADGEAVIGATIQATHVPSGTHYGTITNLDGRYNIQGMRTGGPYKVEVSYVGYQSQMFTGVTLSLGDNMVLNATLKESSELLDEVLVVASKDSNMKSDRAGALTSVGSEKMGVIPTVSRSMNDIMRLAPQASSTTNGFAVGGGNYRQSNVTIDGAQFNNTFGLGSGNLPGGGTPISLDAIEQMTVSVTPYDVRQSGFIGGAINAVTKSGTNEFKGTAYAHLTSNDLKGTRVGDQTFTLDSGHKSTYGFTLGGPIIKDKLFFFVNAELEDNIAAGPTARAGSGKTPYTNDSRRPTLGELNSLTDYLQKTYGYTTGIWQGYNLDTPSHRILARLDWNINDDHRFNIRFTKSNRKSSSGASTSRSIGGSNLQNAIYGGSNGTYGSGSYYGMSSFSSRYYAEYRFTSVAAELNSKFGKIQNTLRGTYSFQDQPRSTEYGDNQPIIELVMNDGQGHYPTWALTGDVFTYGNLSQTKNLVLTDELSLTLGKHHLFGGLQYEYNKAANGFAQAGAGYYAFEVTPEEAAAGNWAAVFGRTPRVFAMTYGNNEAHSMFTARMSTNQWSLYLQDNIDLTTNFKLSAGVRFELPNYPSLKNNYNEDYYKLAFGDEHFRTDNVPGNSISVSPRVGFNWDITGERKYVLRGGTGLFVGRMPFVWLVSAVGNSGMGQTSYLATDDKAIKPSFTMSQEEMLKQINATSATSVPTGPTIMADDLCMPKTWKASLAFDAKLPGDIDFTLEGIYNKDLNPVVVSNKNVYWDGTSTVDLGHGDIRHKMSTYNAQNQAYVLENAGKKAYYYSVTAQLHKKFNFGLDLSASYTHSMAKSYTEGIGDQVSSAYTNYRNSISAVNDNETGYATYVAPNRILLSASYKLKSGSNSATTFSLIYDGSENGFMGNYSYSRYSYIFSKNVTNDASAPGNLLYIPASRQELDSWKFADNGTVTDLNGDKVTYTADMQRDDFWTYINQDDYLKNRKGQYAERGGAKMAWHHQLDFKIMHEHNFKIGNTKHSIQYGLDIENLPNLLNPAWGNYKQVISNTLLSYDSNKGYTYNTANGERHLKTYQKYSSTYSTYQVLFSIRYTFN